MRLVVPLRPVLRWTQGLLFACAGSMLVYCGFVLIDGWAFQKDESRQLERLLADKPPRVTRTVAARDDCGPDWQD